MFIGMGMPIPDLSNLAGPSRPGGGGGAFEYTAIDNSFSMEFDGASDSHYIIPSDTFTANNSGFSLCFWYYKTAYQTGMVISKTPQNFEVYTHVNGNALWTYFAVLSANTNKIPVVLNSWQHICYVVSATDCKGYQNGELTVENTFASTPNYTNQSSDIYLGSRGGTSQSSDITLDEVAFFNSELSDKTIKAIYDATANNPGKVANLSETPEGAPAAWYRMGD